MIADRHAGTARDPLVQTLDMDFPTPQDAKNAPVWENYVIAQAAQASLRQVPADAHALGVEVKGSQVTLVVRVASWSEEAQEDVEDIVSELEGLLGQDVAVLSRVEVTSGPLLRPDDAIGWFFAARP